MARFTIREAEEDEDGNDYDDFFYELFDALTGEVVFRDGGEPEDQTLSRNLRPLVDLLNKVAEETP